MTNLFLLTDIKLRVILQLRRLIFQRVSSGTTSLFSRQPVSSLSFVLIQACLKKRLLGQILTSLTVLRGRVAVRALVTACSSWIMKRAITSSQHV